VFVVLRAKSIAACAAIVAAIALAVVYAGRPVATLVQTAVAERKVPIYKVARDDNKLAISFDATWGVDQTDEILDILDRHGVKTTFFLAGYWVEKHPDYVRKIKERGHEIGNHSYAHPHMNALTHAQIRADLKKNHDLIKEITGDDAFLFRPPFGEYSNKVIEAAESLGYFSIQWSIDSLDWKDVSAEYMVDRVLKSAGPGEIVLFHNAGKHTPRAVDMLLSELKSRGLEVVPISELIYKERFVIESHSGVQRRLDSPGAASGGRAALGFLLMALRDYLRFAAAEPAAAPAEGEIPGKDQPVRKVPGRPKQMAITVNVDWGNEVIPGMLDVFDRYGVKATFFLTGRWAAAFPEMAALIASRGHEIANHGVSHAHPVQLSTHDLRSHIGENADILRRAAGVEPAPLYAPPYGEVNDRVVREAAALGYWTTLWTLDTIDWQEPAPDTIVQRIVPRAEDGAIVLMHPKPQTLEALPRLIEGLQAKGYALVPLYRMILGTGPPGPRQG